MKHVGEFILAVISYYAADGALELFISEICGVDHDIPSQKIVSFFFSIIKGSNLGGLYSTANLMALLFLDLLCIY